MIPSLNKAGHAALISVVLLSLCIVLKLNTDAQEKHFRRRPVSTIQRWGHIALRRIELRSEPEGRQCTCGEAGTHPGTKLG